MSFAWADGRKLSSGTKGTDSFAYTYDANGLRSSKTVNGTTTEYYWLNGTLQAQKTGSEYIVFLHDENGVAYGFLLKNGTVYCIGGVLCQLSLLGIMGTFLLMLHAQHRCLYR